MAPASAAASSLRPPPGLGIGSGLGIGRTHTPQSAPQPASAAGPPDAAASPTSPLTSLRAFRQPQRPATTTTAPPPHSTTTTTAKHASPEPDSAQADAASASADKPVSPAVAKPPAVPAVVLSASKRAPFQPTHRVRYTIQTLLQLSGPLPGEPDAHPAPLDTTPFHIWYGAFRIPPSGPGGAPGGRGAPSYRAARPEGHTAEGGSYYTKRAFHNNHAHAHEDSERDGRPHGPPSTPFKAAPGERRALPRRRVLDAEEPAEDHSYHPSHPGRDGTADAASDWRRPTGPTTSTANSSSSTTTTTTTTTTANSRSSNRKQRETVPSWMDEDPVSSGPSLTSGMDDIQAFKAAMRERERAEGQPHSALPPPSRPPPGLGKSVGPPTGVPKPPGLPPGLGLPPKGGEDSLESDPQSGRFEKRDITPTDNKPSSVPSTGRSSRFARFFDSTSHASSAAGTKPDETAPTTASSISQPAPAPQLDLAALFGTLKLPEPNASSSHASPGVPTVPADVPNAASTASSIPLNVPIASGPAAAAAAPAAAAGGAGAAATASDDQASMAKVLAMLAGSASGASPAPPSQPPAGLAPPPHALYRHEYHEKSFPPNSSHPVHPAQPNHAQPIASTLLPNMVTPPPPPPPPPVSGPPAQVTTSPGSPAVHSPATSRAHSSSMRPGVPPSGPPEPASGPMFPLAQGPPPGVAPPPGLAPQFGYPLSFFPPEGMPPPSRQLGPGVFDPYSARPEPDAPMLLGRGGQPAPPPGVNGLPPGMPPQLMAAMMSGHGMVRGPGGVPLGLPPNMQPPLGWDGLPLPMPGPRTHGGHAGGPPSVPPPGLRSGMSSTSLHQPPPWAQAPLPPPSNLGTRDFVPPSPSTSAQAGAPAAASAADLMAFLTGGGNAEYRRQ